MYVFEPVFAIHMLNSWQAELLSYVIRVPVLSPFAQDILGITSSVPTLDHITPIFQGGLIYRPGKRPVQINSAYMYLLYMRHLIPDDWKDLWIVHRFIYTW